MDKARLDSWWDLFRQKYGIYLRALDAIPDDRFGSPVIPGMRSPAEMAVHVSGSIVRDIAEGVAKGRITADEKSEPEVTAGLGGKAAVLEFARRCFEQADRAVGRIGDAELAAMVPTPWNMTIPGWFGFELMRDEMLHHRGQLYAFVRLCGVEPPFVGDFGKNEAAYRPRVAAR